MNEKELREKAISIARSYIGAKQGSVCHKKIIDTFNEIKPDGWAMTYTAYWCAAFVSSIPILAFGVENAKKYFPLSANCPRIIAKAKTMKIWQESDAYKPDVSDWLLYDWDEKSAKGDCVNDPDHVGIVESVSNGIITVIEGNYRQDDGSRVVGRRKVPVNGIHIRGFVTPNYSAMANKKIKKTLDQIAQEVMDGKWGNGDERKKKLKAAGYNYDDVQKKVNEIMAKKKVPMSKQLVDLARKQLGNGYKKYCAAFGKNTSWCMIFFWWLCKQKKVKCPKTSFARKFAAYCKKHYKHIGVTSAEAGDVVFYVAGKNGNNRCKHKVVHMGIIRCQSTKGDNGDWYVHTIEGNVGQAGHWRTNTVGKRKRNVNRVWGIFRLPFSKLIK